MIQHKKKVLLIYYLSILPQRQSAFDHLVAFKTLPGCDVVPVNIAFFPLSKFLLDIKFDFVVFHYSLCGLRFNRTRFRKIICRNRHLLLRLSGIKIACPQDEFIHMDLLCEMINEFSIDGVLTVSPLSEIKKLYLTVDSSKVKFRRVLTGYLSEQTVKYASSIKLKKTIKMGYRVVSYKKWGEFSLLKSKVADLFAKISICQEWPYDIKVGEEYFLTGKKWIKFLSRCQFVPGCEGGATILDWDGSYFNNMKPQSCTSLLNPQNNVNIGRDLQLIDGYVDLKALSPRHLEAAATRACQILVEGDYNGVLRPWVHYIPLKPDFSNIDVVVEAINDSSLIGNIVDRCYNDLVASRNYSYSRLQRDVLLFIEELASPGCGRIIKDFSPVPVSLKFYIIAMELIGFFLGYLYGFSNKFTFAINQVRPNKK